MSGGYLVICTHVLWRRIRCATLGHRWYEDTGYCTRCAWYEGYGEEEAA